MTAWRYFLAHAKSDPDAVIDRWAAAVRLALETTHGEGMVEVVPGRDDFRNRAGALGGWKEWLPSVATGKDWKDNPIFDGIVVPLGTQAAPVGKATADMVELALGGSKSVYAYIVSDETFWPVTGATKLDGNSWIAWATLTLQKAEVTVERKPSEADFIEACRDLIERATDLGREVEAAENFCDSVAEKAEGMMQWSEEHDGYATDKMRIAIENMFEGIVKWEDRRR